MMLKIGEVPVHNLFLIFGLIFGLLFLFLTPPFQVPDEEAHLYKSFHLSQGKIKADYSNIEPGIYIPNSLNQTTGAFVYLHYHAERKLQLSSVWQLLNGGVKGPPVFKDHIGTLSYPPFPYLVSALTIKIGDLTGASPLIWMYLGRIANLLVWLFLVYWAIRITPVHKWVFMALALMPMTIFLAGSLSADSFTIAISFLTIAFLFKYAFDPEKEMLEIRDLGLLLLLFISLTLSKQLYNLVILLFLLIPSSKLGGRRNKIVIFVLMLLSVFVVQWSWSLLIGGPTQDVSAVSTTQNSINSLLDPVKFLNLLEN
ncbi:MAG TPA: DUF2142 domain-containing protein, partial [Methanobacteriaceae archaeon]|nr:DUF2142 domain-containing protein [Methanobacteriaceae archaeon]